MTGPSDKAVEAACDALGRGSAHRERTQQVTQALVAAHDPALGRDASVNLGAVLDAYERWQQKGWTDGLSFVAWLEREHREGRL